MLAVEQQLRLKKDELRDLLSSRKRKLSQLYEVTVCPGLKHSKDRAHDHYLRQLQAFQDVNDLLKNRLFDESSLPPRHQITRTATERNGTPIPSQTPASAAKTLAESSSSTVQRSKSPAKLITQPSKISPARSPIQTDSPSAAGTSKPLPSRPPDGANTETTEVTTTDTGATESTATASLKLESHDQVSTPNSTNAAAAPSPRISTTKRSPEPQIAPDAQSSPTSSSGRPSSHTPGPEAASPTTSPGDENAPMLDIMTPKAPEPHRENPATPDIHLAPTHKMSVSSIDVDMIDTDVAMAFDSPVQSSKQPPVSPKESKVIKPPISVNTQAEQKSYFDVTQSKAIVETPGDITAQSPPKQPILSTPSADSARRATRIQSGALQKKSVSEILGETPRPASPNDLPRADRKEKDRSRLSTVVFAKPSRPVPEADTIEIARTDQPSKDLVKHGERDYMYTLFESKAYSQNRQGSLPYLLQHAHKTISTSDHLVDYHYQAHCRVLKRLYQLQNLDKWSLRQRKRAEEPARQTSHWDFVLDHAKWMRTDFREERRWKIAAARALADACADWVSASPEDRKTMQVNVRLPRVSSNIDGAHDHTEAAVSSPPELVPHDEDDSVTEDIADPRDIISSTAPAAIFSLSADDVTFCTEKTVAFDKLLNELPLYQPAQIEPDLSKSNLAEKLDSRWKTDVVPVSRYATEKLKVKEHKPPLKRSRYDYDVDDSPPSKRQALEPRESGVALFMTENKHIRDRIHPGHAFRPPAEHPMPSQAFFETRQSSQWLASEDDEVKRQAREYSFNWTLISELMTPPTLYTSGQDRRSAWECFERWIGLEGMPADMAKTPYFKTYSNRIETAQRNVQAQWEEHERRAGVTPNPNRRKTTLPARVERKSNRRHLFMLDAMRKLAKKRETLRQKAIQSADMAAMRKSNDVHAPRPGMKTPAEWSQLKFEREQKMAKQQEMYKQQLIAHQRAVVQQQRGGQAPAANGVQGAPQPGAQLRGGVLPPNGAGAPGMPNGHLQVPNGQLRPPPNMMGMPQGMGVPTGMVGPKGMPQQMMGMNRGMAGSPQQMKMQQEQLLRQAQHAQANGAHSSPNVQQATMANGQGVNNAAQFMNNMNGANTQGSPPNATANSASPRPGSSHIPQTLSSGPIPKINQLYASIKERNPGMSDEEVRNIATQQLLSWQQQATAAAAGTNRPKVNQAALNAAMGAANSGAFAAAAQNQNAMNANTGVSATPNMGQQGIMSYEQAQQYHQRMRMQQAQQNATRGMAAPVPGGMMNSPNMGMVRPVSQHSQQSGMGASGPGMGNNRNSATPVREQRAGSVSTNAVAAGPQQNTVTNAGAAGATPQPQPQPQPQAQPQAQNTPQGQQSSPRAASQAPVQT